MKVMLIMVFNICVLSVQSQVMPEKSGEDWEVLYDKIPVSGEIRVGVLEEFNDKIIRPKTLHVLLPEKSTKSLCVEVCSKDGRYKASRNYKIENLNIGVNKLIWPTKLEEKLIDYNKRELSILCSVGRNCEDEPNYYVLASWSNDFSSDTISLLLKSEVPPSISINDREEKEKVMIKCKKIEKEPRITFDCKCDIPKNLLKPNSEIKIVKRVRKVNRVSFKRYDFPIKIF